MLCLQAITSSGIHRIQSRTVDEAVVARNSSVLEEGYIYGAEYLSRIKPDLIIGGIPM